MQCLLIDIRLMGEDGSLEQLERLVILPEEARVDTDTNSYVGEMLARPEFRAVTKSVGVQGVPRKATSVWTLVARMLKAMGYE